MRRYGPGYASLESIVVTSEELDEGVNACHKELFQVVCRMEEDREAGGLLPPADDKLDFLVYHALLMSFLCWCAVYASPMDADAPDEETRINDLREILLSHTAGCRPLPYNIVGLCYAPRCPATLVVHKKTLYVACRGTRELREYLGDMDIRLVPVNGILGLPRHGCVHQGFLTAFQSQAEGVLARTDALVQEGKVGHVVFCGHSLGGAVAQLLGVVYAQRRHDRRQIQEPTVACVGSSVVSFGCTRIGDAAFRAELDRLVDHTRLYVRRDPFPAIPPWYAPHGGTARVGGWKVAPTREAVERCAEAPARFLSTWGWHRLTTYAAALKDHRSIREGVAWQELAEMAAA